MKTTYVTYQFGKGKNRPTVLLVGERLEPFIYPMPFHSLLCFHHGIGIVKMKSGKLAASWSDAKRHVADVMRPDVVEAVDSLVAKATAMEQEATKS